MDKNSKKEIQQNGNTLDLKEQRRVVWCPRLSRAPVIDGKTDDPVWKEASILKSFLKTGGNEFPQMPTEVRIGRDSENLYIAAVLHEEKMNIEKITPIRTAVHRKRLMKSIMPF